MAERRERVTLAFDAEAFSGKLILASEAARQMHLTWALRDATWEPHDWSTF